MATASITASFRKHRHHIVSKADRSFGFAARNRNRNRLLVTSDTEVQLSRPVGQRQPVSIVKFD